MADTTVLEAVTVRCAGSSPVPGTMEFVKMWQSEGLARHMSLDEARGATATADFLLGVGRVPFGQAGHRYLVVDTSLVDPKDLVVDGAVAPLSSSNYLVKARSVVVLMTRII